MFNKEETQDTKYRVLLVAYKDLTEKVENDLAYYFISSIRSKKEIEDNSFGVDRSTSGLTYRTGLYHDWFKKAILQKLDEGYKLGIVEIPKSYGNRVEVILRELDEKFGDEIIIVESQDL